MKELIVAEAEGGQRLDKYLKRRLSYAPMSFFYKMLRKKNIVLNGKKADGGEKVRSGDRIRLFLSDETIRKFQYGEAKAAPGRSGADRDCSPAEERQSTQVRTERQAVEREMQLFQTAFRKLSPQIHILFENEHIVIVNKPRGLLSQKAGPDDLSLNEWVAGYVLSEEEALLSQDEILLRLLAFRPSVCHRLDRNTSGIVICAKTPAGSRAVSEMIRGRSIRKFYHLIVHGAVYGAGRITTFLSKDHRKNYVRSYPASEDFKTHPDANSKSYPEAYTNPDSKTVFVTGPALIPDSAKGMLAETYYRSVQTKRSLSLVEAELLTGRSHQLRVHFASIGHPIAGDPRYGDREKDCLLREKCGVHTQLLHCARIEFPAAAPSPLQDLSGLVISCPAPEIFQRVME